MFVTKNSLPFSIFVTTPPRTLVLTVDNLKLPCFALKDMICQKINATVGFPGKPLHPCNIGLHKLGKFFHDTVPIDEFLTPNCTITASFYECKLVEHSFCCKIPWTVLRLPGNDLWIPNDLLNPNWIQNGPESGARYCFEAKTLPSFVSSLSTTQVAPTLLSQTENEYFLSTKYADLFFSCTNGALIPAHSYIVLQHSMELYNAVKTPFEEPKLKQILYFIYFGYLDPTLSFSDLLALRVEAIRFSFPKLIAECNKQIDKSIDAVKLPLELVTMINTTNLPGDVYLLCIVRLMTFIKALHSPVQVHELLCTARGSLKDDIIYHFGKGLEKKKPLFNYCEPDAPPLTAFELFQNGKNSDMVIEVGPFTFKVHRIVLCSNCQFFRLMLDGPFKENFLHKLVLPVEAYPIPAFGEFLRLLYTGSVYFSTIMMAIELAELGDMLLQGKEEKEMKEQLNLRCCRFLKKQIRTVHETVAFLKTKVVILPSVTQHCKSLLSRFIQQRKLTKEMMEQLPALD